MKKFLQVICAVCSIILSLPCCVIAEGNTANAAMEECQVYQILVDVFADPSTHADLVSASTLHNISEKLANGNMALPDNTTSDGTVYTYDLSLQLLELELGSYHSWSIEQKHLFDQLMASIGQLPYCFNLLPPDDDISQDAALELAISEVHVRYGVAQENLRAAEQIIFSYYIADADSPNGMWRINIQIAQGESYSVHVFNGRVIHCAKDQYVSDLEKEYNALCESKGAFFTWSLYDKMIFAQSLPEKLAQAERSSTLLMSETELRAIAEYGFCLPTSDCIDQNAAYELALNAVTNQYTLAEGWESQAEVYYSFFYQPDDGYTWRVIFWKTGVADYPSGVVDLDASSGEVLRIDKNGTKPNEYIPLVDRL